MELWELKQRQSLPLDAKVSLTKQRLRQWIAYWDEMSWRDGIEYMPYVSFSGGKDSTVLANIARKIDPRVPLVFVDTGIEYPEIRKFVRSFINDQEQPTRLKINDCLCEVYKKSNIYIMHPSMGFKQVIDIYGYPVVSKEVSNCIANAKKGNTRWKRLHGELMDGDKKSLFNCEKWKFLLYADFKCSDMCCHITKRHPISCFEKEFNGKPLIAIMAEESRQRKIKYMKNGCNSFYGNTVQSIPMAFWTEQDVLHYLKEENIPYSIIYGDIIPAEYDADGNIQLNMMSEHLMTTGEERTGCMFCMFGVHLEKGENRFQRMKRTHPKHYDAGINKLGCGKVLDKIGVGY